MRTPSRLNHLSIKLMLATAAYMLLLWITVVTAVNLGLNNLQNDTAHLSTSALSQQGRVDLQERVLLEAKPSAMISLPTPPP
ncbi:MAG: hypothetical protein M5U34_09665 [Chloroflexi bacterium]|nr:hypothetical protein [Chloroflexota bacterium]